jgi:ferredoxin--NADP+ reductase
MAEPSEKHQQATITARKDYAPDLWSIRIRPEERLVFQPGQYATLGVIEDGRLRERAYSICSSPLEDEIEFFLELLPQGELSPGLYQLQVGDALTIRRQAKGLFLLDGNSGHPQHLLVATVTGIAPFVSMVRTLARQTSADRPQGFKVVVLHAASRSWEFAYREELEALARQFSWLRYIPTISRPWEDPDWKGEVGRIEDVLRKHLDNLGLDPARTTAYVCGHPQMIANSKGILARRGFAKEFIREEGYWVPKKGEK